MGVRYQRSTCGIKLPFHGRALITNILLGLNFLAQQSLYSPLPCVDDDLRLMAFPDATIAG